MKEASSNPIPTLNDKGGLIKSNTYTKRSTALTQNTTARKKACGVNDNLTPTHPPYFLPRSHGCTPNLLLGSPVGLTSAAKRKATRMRRASLPSAVCWRLFCFSGSCCPCPIAKARSERATEGTDTSQGALCSFASSILRLRFRLLYAS